MLFHLLTHFSIAGFIGVEESHNLYVLFVSPSLFQGCSIGVPSSDGSRILGLGDLGVQGIGIPRLEGEEYLSIVDDFMEAVHTCWPKAIVQFEDFQMKWPFETLQRYRKRFCMFNDDIQGTAGVALVGLLGTVRAQGRPLSDFVNQKIVVVGAGSAGLGVLNMTIQAVSRMAGNNDSSLLYQKQRRKGRDHKKSMVESIRQGVENYNSVFVFTVENMRNLKFKELREQLKSASSKEQLANKFLYAINADAGFDLS
ncbi:NAD-dependent malic enzyme 59 kDa isoform, mitochondrial-like isoform X1 [Cucumis sativus]|uniref:NAD-dependent malic enzyme 59 kDa isoform, mitochondrial-like isoform X1 n=1 Tax=Cucumis sativus TaxID=3659 RepID=UPI0012F4A9E7|nr:NAD-dependent malic enzyme 59 kDa isoform, mitochondrial-like isoform X1 [Cucumis sativus]XP_031745824.1 NAD-dependent malic enzyme 59 kDa isoform, mitochondrial-like isoform X1 [Cucumis sativus]XP_031745825.1 NAD-dependent malic enzyme 59 kDa isoform, mitochondrial-like isoform X1 [Cucumis sativus]XP_031745826.1 NAD-dependent malic enzyme 59 kDa isoform, mitochondrial-like isoform X1 [Cucumis sativus]XP_031745827.1 NAD-dependent malic enzyme 59 kDa isoform, mitochondrial-like isoform X1 [Cu